MVVDSAVAMPRTTTVMPSTLCGAVNSSAAPTSDSDSDATVPNTPSRISTLCTSRTRPSRACSCCHSRPASAGCSIGPAPFPACCSSR